MSQMSQSPRMDKVMRDAYRIARERGSEMLGTEHVLIALMFETGGVAHEALLMCGVDAEKLMGVVNKLSPPAPKACVACGGTGKEKV